MPKRLWPWSGQALLGALTAVAVFLFPLCAAGAASPLRVAPSEPSSLPAEIEAGAAGGPQRAGHAIRSDGYREFKVLVLLHGRPVAGFRQMSGVGGRSRTATSTAAAVVLSKGTSRDADFESWAASALGGRPAGMPFPRRNLVIETFDAAGDLVASYRVRSAWVSEYRAAPDFDASASSVVIRRMKLETEGIQLVSR